MNQFEIPKLSTKMMDIVQGIQNKRHEILERFAEAFLAETGLNPSEVELVETTANLSTSWRFRQMTLPITYRHDAPDQNIGPIDEAAPLGFLAKSAQCVHLCLDERGIPRQRLDGEGLTSTLSLWGRVLLFAEAHKEPQA